jgi:hypothetical protein
MEMERQLALSSARERALDLQTTTPDFHFRSTLKSFFSLLSDPTVSRNALDLPAPTKGLVEMADPEYVDFMVSFS